MDKEKAKSGDRKNTDSKSSKAKSEPVSYRLKCAKTANGLSHFIMYGDVPKEKSPL
ncbi:MAG: hypothetical protein AB1510_04360 [Bacillota bacterium]